MAITFNAIPVGILTPGSFIEYSDSQAAPSLAIWSTKILVFGQMLAAGSAAPLTVSGQIFTPQQAQALYGPGSMLATMLAAILEVNTVTPIFAMGVVDNGAGVKASFTHTFTAAPTGPGTLAFYVGGNQVEVEVAGTETVAQMATNLAAAINAATGLPITATAAAGVVTSTVNWKGLTGNDLDFRLNYYASDVMPAGLALTLAAGVAGAGNPVPAGAVAAIGAAQYQFIVWPWTDGASLAALATELANRRGPMEQIQGSSFSAAKGSQGALAALGATMNSPDISIAEAVGPVTTWERAAREGGTIALYGSIDPARPFQTLALIGDIAPNQSERFTQAERQALLSDGISTHTVDNAGNVLIERPVTTYRTDAVGAPDASYLDVNTMLTLSYLRFTIVVDFQLKFPRMKLADDGTPIAPGQPIVTPKTLGAELVALAYSWQDAGLVDNVARFQNLLVVQRDAANPSQVDALIPPNIISGLRVFAGQIDFAF